MGTSQSTPQPRGRHNTALSCGPSPSGAARTVSFNALFYGCRSPSFTWCVVPTSSPRHRHARTNGFHDRGAARRLPSPGKGCDATPLQNSLHSEARHTLHINRLAGQPGTPPTSTSIPKRGVAPAPTACRRRRSPCYPASAVTRRPALLHRGPTSAFARGARLFELAPPTPATSSCRWPVEHRS
jgi:hypothetical protein